MERDRRGRLPWPIVLLVVAFACAIAIGSAWLFTKLTTNDSFARYSVVQLNSMQKLETVSDGFVYYDGSTIAKVGSDTNSRWGHLIGVNADFSATDYGVAAWTNQTLTLIDCKTGTTSYSGPMGAQVLSAHVGRMYAAVQIGEENNSTIVLMETGGQRIDSITLADQTVIDYGFFSSGSLFWVMTLDTNGTVPSCTVSTYNPGRRIVGTITDTDQVMYQVMFQSSQIYCAGDSFLKLYDYTGKEDTSKRKLIYGWYLADVDDSSNDPMMAFVASGQYDGGAAIKDVRMIRGDQDQIVRMPFGCTSVVARGNRVYGFSSDGYIMVAQMGVQKVLAYRLPIQMEHFYGVAEGNVAIIGDGDTVYLVSLE